MDNVGDMVMLSPALESLRQAYPAASITLLASPAGARVAPMLPQVDDVIVHRAAWQALGGVGRPDVEAQQALFAELATRQFDAAFIFTSFSQSPFPPAYACYLAGVPVRVGQSAEFGGAVLSHAVTPPAREAHQADRNLHLLREAGVPAAAPRLRLSVPAEDAEHIDALLAAAGVGREEPFILVAPGASCAARRYPARRSGAAARQLSHATGLPVVIAGGQEEGDTATETLAAIGGARGVSLAGQTTVPQLAALIRRASLLLANDSGPMHIADALETPMVITFSGTDLESQWRPRTAPAVILRRPTACAPCYRFECPTALECLDIPPEEVVAAGLHLLETTASVRRTNHEEMAVSA